MVILMVDITTIYIVLGVIVILATAAAILFREGLEEEKIEIANKR